MRARRATLVLTALGAVLLAAAWLSVGLGTSAASWSDLSEVMRGRADPTVRAILLDIRLPRVVLAALVGAALSGAGVVFQAVLRNPLADPYILGVSGGAALGAVLFMSLAGEDAFVSPVGRPLAAFAGSLLSLGLLLLARIRGRTDPTALLLVGVIVNAFFSAVILFLMTAGDASLFQRALGVLVGSVRPQGGTTLVAVGAFIIAGLLLLQLLSYRLNLLAFGDEAAEHLGVDVERVTWLAVGGASLVTAAAVAFTGLVGFVGLIVPHLLRTLVGADHRLLLPAACLGGGAFVVLADTAARTVVAPADMPVGVITALVGGPFFLFLFIRHLRER